MADDSTVKRRKRNEERRKQQSKDSKKPSSDDRTNEYKDYALVDPGKIEPGPDVLIDVPVVKVDKLEIEVDDLRALVAVQAKVRKLLDLDVGVAANLGKVELQIEGVEAQALLKARLENVQMLLDRVALTLDRNPALLAGIARAVEDVGAGGGELFGSAGDAVEDVGEGAEQALPQIGQGANQALQNVGQGAAQGVGGLGQGVGQGVGQLGQGAGQGVAQAGQGVGQGLGQAGQGIGQGVGQAGQGAGQGLGNLAGQGQQQQQQQGQQQPPQQPDGDGQQGAG